MKTFLLAVAILLIPSAPYLASYVHLSNYYKHNGIRIEYWASPEEMQAMSTEYFIKYIYEMVIVLAISISLIFLNEAIRRSIDAAKSKRQKKSLRILSAAVKFFGIGLMLYLAFFEDAKIPGEWFSAILLSIIVVVYLMLAFKDYKDLPQQNNIVIDPERKIMLYAIVLSLTMLFFHSSLWAIARQEWLDRDKSKVTVKTKTKTIDNVKFLGKTSQAYFFATRFGSRADSVKTYIIRSEDVVSMQFVDGQRSVIIY